MILIRKTFQYIWVKKFLPNQDLAHSQVRPGFGSEIISQYKHTFPDRHEIYYFNTGNKCFRFVKQIINEF